MEHFLPCPPGRSHQLVSSVPQSPQHRVLHKLVRQEPAHFLYLDLLVPQMTSRCRSQSSARLPSATPPGASTLWRERRGTSTLAPSARATAGGCCVRQRCAHRCSARTPPAPRTPAAHSAQVTGAAPRGYSPSLLIPQKPVGRVEPQAVTCQAQSPVSQAGVTQAASFLNSSLLSITCLCCQYALHQRWLWTITEKCFYLLFLLTVNLRLKRESCHTKLFQMILLLWKVIFVIAKCEEQLLIKNVT